MEKKRRKPRPDLAEYNRRRALTPEWKETRKKIGAKNKGRTFTMTDQHKKNIAASKIGALNPMWKGDDVGYYTLHAWLTEHFGSPAKCEKCGKIGEKVNGRWNIEWASKDNKTYSRKRKDYLGMCRSCHLKHDYKLGAREGVKDAHLKRHRGEGGKFL